MKPVIAPEALPKLTSVPVGRSESSRPPRLTFTNGIVGYGNPSPSMISRGQLYPSSR